MKKIGKTFRMAFIFSLSMFVICGLLYPLALTALSQTVFPHQANGSIVEVDGKAVGSAIVGQDFTDERLFHCRPSAYQYNTYTEEQKANGEYSGPASGSNNYGNSNEKLKMRIAADVEAFLKENPTVDKKDIPADIVTASGSGLDPHISVEAAQVQVDRVAKNSGLKKDELQKLIEEHTQGKSFGVLGEEKVNVLLLNLDVAKAIGMLA